MSEPLYHLAMTAGDRALPLGYPVPRAQLVTYFHWERFFVPRGKKMFKCRGHATCEFCAQNNSFGIEHVASLTRVWRGIFERLPELIAFYERVGAPVGSMQ